MLSFKRSNLAWYIALWTQVTELQQFGARLYFHQYQGHHALIMIHILFLQVSLRSCPEKPFSTTHGDTQHTQTVLMQSMSLLS